jgi:hypothetical protein
MNKKSSSPACRTNCGSCAGLPAAPQPPCHPQFSADGAVPVDQLYDQLRVYLDAFALNPVFVQYGFDFTKNPGQLVSILKDAFQSIWSTFSCHGYHVTFNVFDQSKELTFKYNVWEDDLDDVTDSDRYGHHERDDLDGAPELHDALERLKETTCRDGLAFRASRHDASDEPLDACDINGAVYRARAFGDHRCNPFTYILRVSISGRINHFHMLVPEIGMIEQLCEGYGHGNDALKAKKVGAKKATEAVAPVSAPELVALASTPERQ